MWITISLQALFTLLTPNIIVPVNSLKVSENGHIDLLHPQTSLNGYDQNLIKSSNNGVEIESNSSFTSGSRRSFESGIIENNYNGKEIKENKINDLSTWDTISIPIQNSVIVSDDTNNEVQKGELEEEDDPEEELSGFYSDCVFKFSYTCIQKKVLAYIRKISVLQEYDLIGDKVSIVRINREADITPRMDERKVNDVATLDSLLDDTIIGFLRSHVLRVKFPAWSAVAVAGSPESARQDAAIDFSLGSTVEGKILFLIRKIIFM